MNTETTRVKGWGSDASDASRPGVPMERTPAPLHGVSWTKPEQQPLTVEVLKHKLQKNYTSTFGTGPAPKGLSGVLRRLAYKIPEHRPEKWMMCLFADRVDVIEHGNPFGKWMIMPASMLATFAGLAAWRLLKPNQ